MTGKQGSIMQLTIDERNALTKHTTLSHSQLQQREKSGGFAASLDELERADADGAQKVGEDWWLAKLMAPVVNQVPPAEEYDLAKAENEARHTLKMRPNSDTLMTQYYEEIFNELWAVAYAKLLEENPEPTSMEVAALREQVEAQATIMAQAKVDKVIAEWEAGIHSDLDELTEDRSALEQFEAQFEASTRVDDATDEDDAKATEAENPFRHTQRLLEEIQQSVADKVEWKQMQTALTSTTG